MQTLAEIVPIPSYSYYLALSPRAYAAEPEVNHEYSNNIRHKYES